MENILEVKGLVKSYGRNKALDGLSMTIPKGAVYGFVGRNGAGKTTLMHGVCGLSPTSGGEYSLTCRRLGAMVEAPALYGGMTAEENMRQQYRLLGMKSFDGIDELLKLVGLESTGKKRVKHFSQGMRQKLGIAIALCGEPDFVILDEPANGLDPQGIIELRELVTRLNRDKGITFLISSHILDELSRLATHYGFIHHGKMVKEMTAAQLEQECSACTHVAAGDSQGLVRVLDRMGLPYRLLPSGVAEVYSEISGTQLAAELSDEGCELLSIARREADLQAYFLELVGGDRDD